jgi:uncharacterized membrane protein (DUF2068 family)
MQRPTGFTILAALLAWLSLSGLAFTLVAPGLPLPVAQRLALGGFGAAYFVSAASTAVGLWLMRRWACRTYLAWAACSLVAVLLPYAIVPEPGPSWTAVPGIAIFGVVFRALGRYVRRRLTPAG